jgi:hypothetical protein
MARPCIFCGRDDEPSNEDAWPKWLTALLKIPDGLTQTTYIATTDGFQRQLPTTDKVPARLTRAVCLRCNNGWLSRLEDRTRPVLAPLVIGEPCSLSIANQELLATWAIKTALTTQQTLPGEKRMPPEGVYTSLLERQQPPAGYAVYAANLFGRGDTQTPLLWDGTKSTYMGSREEGRDNVFVTILMADSVLFQVIGDFRDGEQADIPPIDRLQVHQIWPPARAFDWPNTAFPRPVVPMLALVENRVNAKTGEIVWVPPGMGILR